MLFNTTALTLENIKKITMVSLTFPGYFELAK